MVHCAARGAITFSVSMHSGASTPSFFRHKHLASDTPTSLHSDASTSLQSSHRSYVLPVVLQAAPLCCQPCPWPIMATCLEVSHTLQVARQPFSMAVVSTAFRSFSCMEPSLASSHSLSHWVWAGPGGSSWAGSEELHRKGPGGKFANLALSSLPRGRNCAGRRFRVMSAGCSSRWQL